MIKKQWLVLLRGASIKALTTVCTGENSRIRLDFILLTTLEQHERKFQSTGPEPVWND